MTYPIDENGMYRLHLDDVVKTVIEYIGDDCLRDGLIDTPKRVVESWKELYSGYDIDPTEYLRWFEDTCDEMIISKNIKFFSTCEHHMLPFHGTAAVGYFPKGQIIGISKLSRIVEAYARRLQVQERLTRQIAELLEPHVNGVAVHIEAEHYCMMARGVKQQNSLLVTNHLTGAFRDEPEARNEFLAAL